MVIVWALPGFPGGIWQIVIVSPSGSSAQQEQEVGDNDGNVGIVDFLELLAQWDGGGSCDFDGGGVGIVDFLALLANWGPCP